MEKKKIILSALSLVILATVLVLSFNPTMPVESNSALSYEATVCTEILRANGEVENLGCSENTLTDAGANLIKSYIGEGGTVGAVDYIALCNASAGCTASSTASTTLQNEFTTSGLERSQATYTSNGVGNWTMAKTFTATADNLQTNKTGIFNASSSGTLFAENTFNLATLYNSDQLTISWTVTISEA